MIHERRNIVAGRAQRSSVSAEVYGAFNKKEDFVARVITKTNEQKERIIARVMQSFLFSSLDDKELHTVIDAFEEVRFNAGDTVISQGETGDVLYLVDTGTLDCFKVFKKGDEPTFLKIYNPGEAFGELALLYNAPRAATIIAKTNCLLWALDRETFNYIVKGAAM
jgi:cAMP-dependent protein kinase regulator